MATVSARNLVFIDAGHGGSRAGSVVWEGAGDFTYTESNRITIEELEASLYTESLLSEIKMAERAYTFESSILDENFKRVTMAPKTNRQLARLLDKTYEGDFYYE